MFGAGSPTIEQPQRRIALSRLRERLEHDLGAFRRGEESEEADHAIVGVNPSRARTHRDRPRAGCGSYGCGTT